MSNERLERPFPGILAKQLPIVTVTMIFTHLLSLPLSVHPFKGSAFPGHAILNK